MSRNYSQVIALMVLEQQINFQKTSIRTRDTSSGCSLANVDSTKRIERSAKRSLHDHLELIYNGDRATTRSRSGYDLVGNVIGRFEARMLPLV